MSECYQHSMTDKPRDASIQLGVLRHVALAMFMSGLATPSLAQESYERMSQRKLLVLNSAAGATIGGVVQKLRGGSFVHGFTRGAVGGAAVYAGKRYSVEHHFGAGLIGREVGAVGSSIIRNAAAGRGMFTRMMLPFGPLHFYLNPDTTSRFTVKVDFLTTAVTTLALLSGEAEIDYRASLSSGAVVIRQTDAYLGVPGEDGCTSAYTIGGVIMASDLSVSRHPSEPILPHERVHILQGDQYFTLVSDPAELWMAKRFPGGKVMKRYVDFNLLLPLMIVPTLMIKEPLDRPWEREAHDVWQATHQEGQMGMPLCGFAIFAQ